VEYFRHSAELGYAPAQTALGSFYDTDTSVSQEAGQALEGYKKAALQDDPVAQWLAGRLIYTSAVRPRDLNEARTDCRGRLRMTILSPNICSG